MWKVVGQTLKYLKWVPFVQAVFVFGDLGKGVSKAYSDIDFLIVTARERVYFCKFFLAIFKRMKWLNHRKLPCFNHLISEAFLEIPEKNIFTAFEIATLVPVYNRTLSDRFLRANAWVAEWIPRYLSDFSADTIPVFAPGRLQTLLEFPFQNSLAARLDRVLLKLWRFYWRRKY